MMNDAATRREMPHTIVPVNSQQCRQTFETRLIYIIDIPSWLNRSDCLTGFLIQSLAL